jgi:protein-L-isoaspartate(D-aspartate) O-methyltransferase
MATRTPPDREVPDEVGIAEAKAAFHLRLRSRGIQDLRVLRAIETVPRALFVPHRHVDLASRDLALPIACGQTMPEPWLVARTLEAARLNQDHRVLEIGTGSGYATAVLSQLVAEVLSVERFQSLATEARGRLEHIGIAQTTVLWGDGMSLGPDIGLFDRIIVHATVAEAIPSSWVQALKPHGLIMMGRTDPLSRLRQNLVVCERTREERNAGFMETAVVPCRLQPLIPGTARGL